MRRTHAASVFGSLQCRAAIPRPSPFVAVSVGDLTKDGEMNDLAVRQQCRAADSVALESNVLSFPDSPELARLCLGHGPQECLGILL
jgi:hypothetical protein